LKKISEAILIPIRAIITTTTGIQEDPPAADPVGSPVTAEVSDAMGAGVVVVIVYVVAGTVVVITATDAVMNLFRVSVLLPIELVAVSTTV
jgi:uncharacterized protein YggT (Ycf19 family)